MENEILIQNETDYKSWLVSIKNQIKSAQIKASIAVNEEMLNLYWNIGKDISEKHLDSKYGSGFFDNLSKDLKNDFPNSQGFSSRNLRYMKKFYDFYKNEILHQLGAELEDILFTIPWRQHIEIFTRSKSVQEALFFVQKSKENGWSRAMLINMMDTKLYETRGNTLNNFALTLPKEDSECAKEIPFILDYYDREVSKMINQKYGFSMMDSYKKFLMSETYKMLSNPELEMWEFSENGIFDMWETEQITGNPRNSLYIRRD